MLQMCLTRINLHLKNLIHSNASCRELSLLLCSAHTYSPSPRLMYCCTVENIMLVQRSTWYWVSGSVAWVAMISLHQNCDYFVRICEKKLLFLLLPDECVLVRVQAQIAFDLLAQDEAGRDSYVNGQKATRLMINWRFSILTAGLHRHHFSLIASRCDVIAVHSMKFNFRSATNGARSL